METAWSRWSQGQSPTLRAVPVLSNDLGEEKKKNSTSFVVNLLWGILASDNTLAWYNVVTLIVQMQRWKVQEICHWFSLPTKQCSGKAGLEKCKMWRNPGSSWCAMSYAERLKCKAIAYNPWLSNFLQRVSCVCLLAMPNESSFQSLYLIKRDLTSNPQPHPLKEWRKISQGKRFPLVTSMSPKKKKKTWLETHSNYWKRAFVWKEIERCCVKLYCSVASGRKWVLGA